MSDGSDSELFLEESGKYDLQQRRNSLILANANKQHSYMVISKAEYISDCLTVNLQLRIVGGFFDFAWKDDTIFSLKVSF